MEQQQQQYHKTKLCIKKCLQILEMILFIIIFITLLCLYFGTLIFIIFSILQNCHNVMITCFSFEMVLSLFIFLVFNLYRCVKTKFFQYENVDKITIFYQRFYLTIFMIASGIIGIIALIIIKNNNIVSSLLILEMMIWFCVVLSIFPLL